MSKITIKDLLLHIVDNSQVLSALLEICEVTSEVFYDGKATLIHNGDQYCYVPQSAAAKLPDVLTIAEVEVQILKPKAMATCKRCNIGPLQVTRIVQLEHLQK